MGLGAGKARRLFHMLDGGGQRDVSLDELELVGLKRREVRSLDSPSDQVRQRKAEKRAAHAEAIQHFQGFLVRTFGSVVRGWRLGLDVDGDGKLNWNEFCRQCRRIQYQGHLKVLFQSLDEDQSGFVSIRELDPESAQLIEDFVALLEQRSWTLDDVWEALDPDGNGRCPQDDFLTVCYERLDWGRGGDAARLFRMLDLNGERVLTMDELEFLGVRRRDVSSPTKRQQVLEKRERARAEAAAMLAQFRDFLTYQFRSIVHAWRTVLDRDGDGRLQFTEFCARCREMAFKGNLKALWHALDTDETGFVDLSELDPVAAAHLDDFAVLLAAYFSELSSAWHCLFSWGQCDQETLDAVCREFGYRRSSRRLFGYLCHRDTEYFDLMDLQKLGVPTRLSKEEGAEWARQHHDARSRADFEGFLKARFRANPFIGWRRAFCGLEWQAQLTVSVDLEEFCGHCREIGFQGNLATVFCELRGLGAGCLYAGPALHAEECRDRGRGQVEVLGRLSLESVHPAVFRECEAFREHFSERFASGDEAWAALIQQAKKPSLQVRLRKLEFHRAAAALGFEGSGEVVFDACDVLVERSISSEEFVFLQVGRPEAASKTPRHKPESPKRPASRKASTPRLASRTARSAAARR